MEHVTDDCTCKGKRCPKCTDVKCIECFSTRKNGYKQAYCRKCDGTRLTEWNRNNPEQRKIIVQCYNQSPLAKETQVRYKEAHPERKEPGYWLKYEPGYKEKRLQWRKDNPETVRVNRIRYRARKKHASGSFTAQEWETLKAQYGYACLCCHCQEPNIKLTTDHIVPLSKGGSNSIDNIQPLCFSCNLQKRARTIDFRPKTP